MNRMPATHPSRPYNYLLATIARVERPGLSITNSRCKGNRFCGEVKGAILPSTTRPTSPAAEYPRCGASAWPSRLSSSSLDPK